MTQTRFWKKKAPEAVPPESAGLLHHPYFGRAVPGMGWVPAPRYILRRNRILSVLDSIPRGRLLEIGCGAGALLADLSKLGFRCSALEISEEALEVARFMTGDLDGVEIRQTPDHSWPSNFEVLAAFEVLEHVEDDYAELRYWSKWMKKGGHLLVSAPAHPERWNASDLWAGHYRRYDRKSFEALLNGCGFEVVKIECYGFPLATILEPLRAKYHKKLVSREQNRGLTATEKSDRTSRSGIDRPLEVRFYSFESGWIGTWVLRFSCWLQDRFLETDLGIGYLALARRQ